MEMVEMSGLSGAQQLSRKPELADLSWAAVEACTLPTFERPLRVAEFDSLFEESAVEVRRVDPTHLVVRLSGGHQVAERASELVAKETECCSFFTFRVVEEAVHQAGKGGRAKAADGAAGRIRLEVDVPPGRSAVLSGIAARAEASLGKRAS